jgi:preprotein translocase subunit SecG
MSKMTTGAAIIFMLTSLTLAYLGKSGVSSLMSSKTATKPAAAKQAAPAATPAQGQPAMPPAPKTSP